MFIRLITFSALLLISCNACAQLYIGITGDFGNRLSYQSNTGETYFKQPAVISGSLTFLKEETYNKWLVRYGVAAGVLGYSVKVILKDTLNQTGSYTPDIFLDYTNLYVSVPLALGRQFIIKGKTVKLFFGGGATYYINLFPGGVTGSISVENNNSYEDLFDYEIFPANNKLFVFADLSIQIELNQKISVGLLYRHHFKPALEGTYNFYHVPEPSNGTLSVTQRALSILFLVRVGKNLPK